MSSTDAALNAATRARVIEGVPEELARLIESLALPHPTRVAIDGVDAAGKTTPLMGARP